MTTPTVTETRRHGGRVGERVELARYTIPAGERILYGQRVDGVVRFLGTMADVFDPEPASSEDCTCCPRETREEEERRNAARQKRPNHEAQLSARTERGLGRCGGTGRRVELARYTVTRGGARALCGQRVLGVVRLTDVPLEPGGRAYLVERGLEEEGPNATAGVDRGLSASGGGSRCRPNGGERFRRRGETPYWTVMITAVVLRGPPGAGKASVLEKLATLLEIDGIEFGETSATIARIYVADVRGLAIASCKRVIALASEGIASTCSSRRGASRPTLRRSSHRSLYSCHKPPVSASLLV